jgi:glycosyltransferase involved in cell wall biosynthesis
MKLFVVEPLGAGGMIHYAYQMSTALANEGADVTLITARKYEMEPFPHNFSVEKRLDLWTLFDPRSMEAPPQNRWQTLWRKIHWTARRGIRAARLIREWFRLTNYLLAEKPDVIQFGKINFPFEAFFLARLRRHGLILTQICHEFELREQSGPAAALANKLYANVYSQFSALFFHAESNRARFSTLFDGPAERLHLIPHGNEGMFLSMITGSVTEEDLRRRHTIDATAPVILFFGILTASKGIPDLLQAFAQVHRQQPQARLIIAGFPTKYINIAELRQMTVDLGMAEAVIFDGRYIPFDEVGPLMKLSTVVVYPYRNSTQSGALQVAYAFGRPVIATNVGGLPEAVDDGRSGLLVPPQNPSALAAAMIKFIDDPQMAADMGAYARHLSETRYSWRPIAAKIMAVYRELARQPQQARQPHDFGGKSG